MQVRGPAGAQDASARDARAEDEAACARAATPATVATPDAADAPDAAGDAAAAPTIVDGEVRSATPEEDELRRSGVWEGFQNDAGALARQVDVEDRGPAAPVAAKAGPVLPLVPAFDLKPGWLERAGLGPRADVTSSFDRAYETAKAGNLGLPAEAKDHVYLLVRGLEADGKYGDDYFRGSLDRLKGLGLDARLTETSGNRPVQANAARLREAIEEIAASGKKVVLLGHSKGGVDASAALSLYPEIRDDVRALVTLQSPIGGTQLASDVTRFGPVRGLIDQYAEKNGGDIEAGTDLTYKSRYDFLRQNPYPAGDVRTISVGTARDLELDKYFLSSLYLGLRQEKAPNDGLVAVEDAFLPGADAVRLRGVDHDDIATGGSGSYEAGAATEALIALALAR